jgi:hypothetical protein
MVGPMRCYVNWSTEACIYLSLHGTSGVLWLLMSGLFSHRRFDKFQLVAQQTGTFSLLNYDRH